MADDPVTAAAAASPATSSAPPDTAEAILRTIACAAEQEAALLMQEADADASGILEAARELVAERVATACDAAEVGAREEAARKVNAARLRLVHRRAERASAAVDAAFSNAAARLDVLASGGSPKRWSAALERLAREAVALTGEGSTIDVRAADAPLLAALAEELAVAVTPLDGPDVPAGLVVRSADRRIEVDATVPTRLARARALLTGQLARSLGLEE